MKRRSMVLLAAICVLGAASWSGAAEEVGSAVWNEDGTVHEYKVFLDPGTTWDAAKSWIDTTLGSEWHLATVTSAEEQAFVAGSVFPLAGGGEVWLGGYQDPLDTQDPAANWTWVTGEPWSYTNWASGEPNDARCCGGWPESHLAIHDGGWNDEGYLGNIVGFIAEKTTQTCVQPAAGLRNWWPGDGHAGDVIGGRGGALQNGAVYADGKVGKAFSFDDAFQQYVKVPHNDDLDLTTALTIDAWVMKTGECAPLNCFILAKGNGDFTANTQNGRYGLLIYNPAYGPQLDGRVALAFNTGTWQDVVVGTTKIEDNVWYHVAGTWDGATAKIYVNGVLENSVPKTGTIIPSMNNGSLTIGAEIFADGWIPQGEYFHGLIDEVQIYTRALTAGELASIYRAGSLGTCKPENRPPVANAGPDQSREMTSCAGASTMLDGTGSSDLDGDTLAYSWTEHGTVIATGANPTVILGYGTHTITLTVDDGKGGTATDDVVVRVVDTIPPTLNVTVSPNVLWPPNHKYVTVTPAISVADACVATTKVTLVSATSNEPDNGLGDGDTANDIVVNADGTLSLRAERSRTGSGRVYTITYRAVDIAGNASTATATVTVPHDKQP